MKKAFQLCLAALVFFISVSQAKAANTCELSTRTDPSDPTKIIISATINFENTSEKDRVNNSQFISSNYELALDEDNKRSRQVLFLKCSGTSIECTYQSTIELSSVGAAPSSKEKKVSNFITFDSGNISCASDFTLKPELNPAEIPGVDPGAGRPGSGIGAGSFEGGFTSVTDDVLDSFNPLKVTNSEYAEEFSTPGGILSRFLNVFAFPLAGLILFVMIIWGGFEMVAGATNKKSLDAGRQRITAALIGFILLFASYWIARVLEVALGVNIL